VKPPRGKRMDPCGIQSARGIQLSLMNIDTDDDDDDVDDDDDDD